VNHLLSNLLLLVNREGGGERRLKEGRESTLTPASSFGRPEREGGKGKRKGTSRQGIRRDAGSVLPSKKREGKRGIGGREEQFT